MIGRPYTDDSNPKNQGRVESFPLNTGVNTEKQIPSFWARGVIVDNLTNQWIFVREVFAFIPPYVSGRQIPLTGTQKLSIYFTAPPGFSQQPSIAGQQAFFRATEASVSAAPGVPVAPAPTRWTINSQPAVGVQASVTKAAVSGVIHVADFMRAKEAATTATASLVSPFLRDGASGIGTILISDLVAVQAIIDYSDFIFLGPNLGLKGTIGNAMTVEFSGGQANQDQTVTLVGYDA